MNVIDNYFKKYIKNNKLYVCNNCVKNRFLLFFIDYYNKKKRRKNEKSYFVMFFLIGFF